MSRTKFSKKRLLVFGILLLVGLFVFVKIKSVKIVNPQVSIDQAKLVSDAKFIERLMTKDIFAEGVVLSKDSQGWNFEIERVLPKSEQKKIPKVAKSYSSIESGFLNGTPDLKGDNIHDAYFDYLNIMKNNCKNLILFDESEHNVLLSKFTKQSVLKKAKLSDFGKKYDYISLQQTLDNMLLINKTGLIYDLQGGIYFEDNVGGADNGQDPNSQMGAGLYCRVPKKVIKNIPLLSLEKINERLKVNEFLPYVIDFVNEHNYWYRAHDSNAFDRAEMMYFVDKFGVMKPVLQVCGQAGFLSYDKNDKPYRAYEGFCAFIDPIDYEKLDTMIKNQNLKIEDFRDK